MVPEVQATALSKNQNSGYFTCLSHESQGHQYAPGIIANIFSIVQQKTDQFEGDGVNESF